MGRLSGRLYAVFGMLAVAGHARAQAPEAAPAEAAAAPVTSAPPSPPPSLARPEAVTIFSTETPGSLRVRGPGVEGEDGACPDSCTLKLAPGNYTVVAPDSDDGHVFPVNVPGACHVVLDPGSPALRGLGMGMMIVGGTALIVGLAALYYDVDSRTRPDRRGCTGNVCDEEALEAQSHPYRQPSWVVPAMVAGAIGGVVTLGGTAMFVVFRPTVSIMPLEAAGARRRVAGDGPRFRGLPAVGTTRAGFELTGTF